MRERLTPGAILMYCNCQYTVRLNSLLNQTSYKSDIDWIKRLNGRRQCVLKQLARKIEWVKCHWLETFYQNNVYWRSEKVNEKKKLRHQISAVACLQISNFLDSVVVVVVVAVMVGFIVSYREQWTNELYLDRNIQKGSRHRTAWVSIVSVYKASWHGWKLSYDHNFAIAGKEQIFILPNGRYELHSGSEKRMRVARELWTQKKIFSNAVSIQ